MLFGPTRLQFEIAFVCVAVRVVLGQVACSRLVRHRHSGQITPLLTQHDEFDCRSTSPRLNLHDVTWPHIYQITSTHQQHTSTHRQCSSYRDHILQETLSACTAAGACRAIIRPRGAAEAVGRAKRRGGQRRRGGGCQRS